MRLLSLLTWLLFQAGSALAMCSGADQIAELSAADRATLVKAAAADPYGTGNMWKATRRGHVVYLIGTLHVFDPRMGRVIEGLEPYITDSDLLMVELNRADQSAIQNAPVTDPDRFFILSGDTLPVLLGPERWARLKTALADRGVPGFVAAQFRPWYVGLLLMTSPCMVRDQAAGRMGGLDNLILDVAASSDVTAVSLDNPDDLLTLLQSGEIDEHIRSIDVALTLQDEANASVATMLNAYFAESGRLLWEFNLQLMERRDLLSKEERAEAIGQLRDVLLIGRNTAWIEMIDDASVTSETITVAVGALHLPGESGLVNMLTKHGFSVERIGDEFWQP